MITLSIMLKLMVLALVGYAVTIPTLKLMSKHSNSKLTQKFMAFFDIDKLDL